ncbi:hypothetical protein IVB34_20305 [Bradyrhizobium sp. 2]|uniref:hypothetical protein n=1 Tax=Bradyrhizobium sp. 2 TaxID=190045 RepID=UPI001FF7DB8E|nr:hypothetical protein [Bradyrhizobium sp. 2]MCK1460647.1 hypothetical protein [Bradyrhizobium sp. 2]
MTMRRFMLGFLFALLLVAGSGGAALAQWQVPDHSVAIGRGSGTGFKFAAPGTAGTALISNGAGADPSFQALTNIFGPQSANTVLSGPTSGVAANPSFRALVSGDLPATVKPKNLGSIRFTSQYGGADWCANLIAALADIGTAPGTIYVDGDNQTINACSAVSQIDIGNKHTVQFVSGEVFTLTQTIRLGIGSSIIGTANGPTGGAGTNVVGTTLKWTGVVSGDVLLMFGTFKGVISNINVDCNSVSDCAGIHYDSNNSPPSSYNTIENVTLTRGHYGLLVGNRGTSHPTPVACNSNPSQSGCYEMDFLTFRNFLIFGTCADTTAVGIHVNSYFALQQSTIDTGNIQCANIGIRNVSSAGANTIIKNVVGGSVVGASPTLFQTDAGGAQGYNLWNNESEGGWTYAVHDSGCSGSGTNTESWISNGWNNPVLVDGCQTITETASGSGGITKTVGGSAVVYTSGSNTTAWTPSGSGIVYNQQMTWTPTTACGAGSGTWTGQTGKYTRYPGYTSYTVTATLSAVGTCSSSVTFSLPFTAGVSSGVGFGRESAINGRALAVTSNTTIISVFNYDNTFNGGNGATYQVSGTFASP